MTQLWAFDTEDNSKGKVYLINFYDGKSHHTFTSPERAIKFLCSLEGSVHFWACNLGYDIANLFRDHLYFLEIIYINSRMIECKILDTGIRFRDTLNHWKISVAEMGNRIGLKKLDAGKSFNNKKYCQRDTEIVWKFVASMKEKYDQIGCDLKATIGATSLKLFQNNYFKTERKRIFQSKDIEFMMRGYYGGRTEIFFNKPIEGNIHYYDFNSLYPACSLRDFPRISPRCFAYKKQIKFELEGMADVTIQSPKEMAIPYLPYRPENGGLVFPLGRFRGVWTYFELREAKKLGYKIIKTHKAMEFNKGLSSPFHKFINHLYTERLEAQKKQDTLLSDAYKLLMNNLYGKWAQGNDKTKLYPLKKGMKLERHDEIMGCMVLKKEKGDYPIHTNVIWSAYTTAYARHKLWLAMDRVVREKGLLIYCDTDSLIFENETPLFENNNKLGELKSEGLFKYAHFKLPKEYKLVPIGNKKHIYKAKGVPKKQQKQFFNTGRVTYKKPLKLREVMRRNLSPKRKHKLVANYWDQMEKISKQVYDKRIVDKKGFTKPITIGGVM